MAGLMPGDYRPYFEVTFYMKDGSVIKKNVKAKHEREALELAAKRQTYDDKEIDQTLVDHRFVRLNPNIMQ